MTHTYEPGHCEVFSGGEGHAEGWPTGYVTDADYGTCGAPIGNETQALGETYLNRIAVLVICEALPGEMVVAMADFLTRINHSRNCRDWRGGVGAVVRDANRGG